jgi:DNA-binding NarL/FixJ family response regulator
MLRLLLEREDAWRVVGEADNCRSACEVTEAMRPNIILLDLGLRNENGLDCLPHLLGFGDNRVLVLTGNEDPELHALALEKGASAVLSKVVPPEKIRDAIQTSINELIVEEATAHTSDEALQVDGNASRNRAASHEFPVTAEAKLSEDDRQIIELLCLGCKEDEIAVRLDLLAQVVHQRLCAIYHKLGVADSVALAAYAFRHNLVNPYPHRDAQSTPRAK